MCCYKGLASYVYGLEPKLHFTPHSSRIAHSCGRHAPDEYRHGAYYDSIWMWRRTYTKQLIAYPCGGKASDEYRGTPLDY